MKMRFCGNCGALITPELKICPNCGESTRPEICPDCGTELWERWLFCPHCGRAVNEPVQLMPQSFERDAEAKEDTAEADTKAENTPESNTAVETKTETVSEKPEQEFPKAESAAEDEATYSALIAERDALKNELRNINERITRLNRSENDFQNLSPDERKQLGIERRELRTAQGRCHADLLLVSKRIKRLTEERARIGRELYSIEHPEIVCPNCQSKLRKGVDTWPICPYCGDDVTAPGRPSNCTVMLKVKCGDEEIKHVWYTGNRDFSEYWEVFHGRHSRREYRYSSDHAVLSVEDSVTRGAWALPQMPDDLPPMHTLQRTEPFNGEIDGERIDGLRTENLGTLDMAALSEAERFAFLRFLLTTKPDSEQRLFELE